MKTCYVYQDVYPWDVRAEKIIRSISHHGFESHILSKNNGLLPRTEIIHNNVFVHRLPVSSIKSFSKLMNFPMFFSPFWIASLYSLILETKPDLIIVRDLPLAPMALSVGRITRIPVLMDMAENYPEMIRDTWKYRGFNIIDMFIRNPLALKMLEKLVLPQMDGVLAVSSYSSERIEKIGVRKDRIWIVNNTPDLNKPYSKFELAGDMRNISDFIMLYIGGLEESRGLDIVIKAMPEILKKKNAYLVIVGSGTSEKYLKELAINLRIKDHVHFSGWIDNKYIHSIIDNIDIGIVPHYVTNHTNTTLPNKIFDYMAHGKPVIATNSTALKDIVLTNECGKVYVHTSSVDFAEKVLSLSDRREREQLGINGYRAIIEKYNWKIDESVLIDAINKTTLPRRTVFDGDLNRSTLDN